MSRMEDETKYLDNVKARILEERESTIETLQRIPNEYKGRYSQVKWGDEDLVKDLNEIYTRRLSVIDGLEFNPYFGSFDFAQEKEGFQRFRLGKTDIVDNGKMLVLDWRNPICTLYYDQSNGRVSYVAPTGTITGQLARKSQIRIKDGAVQDIVDVDLVSDDELLKPYLDVTADSRMKTIIASIQAEQNAIIRDTINQNLIVQGVAGSGKTSVALHRIAYLLYSLGKNFDSSKFGIIGPNKYFLNYISKVLPDLDTKGIKELTFEEICSLMLNDNKYTFESMNDELNRFISSKNHKVYDFKGSLDYKDLIDNYLEGLFETAVKGGIVVEGYTLLSEDALRSMFGIKKGNITSINSQIKLISSKIKAEFEDIYYPLTRPLMDEMKKYPLRSPERNEVIARMDAIKESLEKGCAKELKDRFKPLLQNPIMLYKGFLKQLESVSYLYKDEVKHYITDSSKFLSKKVIPCEDRGAILYLSMIQNDSIPEVRLRHVVIDEAQDYSIFEFNVMKDLFERATFSIFGDLAQSIYPNRRLDSWIDVKDFAFDGHANVKFMSKSYRTTKQITEEANHVLTRMGLVAADPVIRDGEVAYMQTKDLDLESLYASKIATAFERGYASVGIICKDEKEMDKVSQILTKLEIPFNLITSKDSEYNGGVNVLTAYLAKGLEFDSVIITDASDKLYYTDEDMHLLYVAMTRALHDLDIFYTDKLAEVLNYEPVKIDSQLLLKK